MEKKITLQEALCGCEFTVNHLDGQQLLVKTQPGDVIAPGSYIRAHCYLARHLPIQSCVVPVSWAVQYVWEGKKEGLLFCWSLHYRD